MQFSHIPTLIDAYVQGQIHGKPLKGASIFLHVASKSPFALEDNNKHRLTTSEADLQAYFHSYEKISQGTNICLENVDIQIEYGKGYAVQNIEISSKSVITDVGTKQIKSKNFQLKASLQRKQGQFPLFASTFCYVRRMEKQQLVKKHYKQSKVDVSAFSGRDKRQNKHVEEDDSYLTTEVQALDSESVSILSHLLKFVDKESLFRVLIHRPLKEKHAKKAVRLAVVPTDVQSESEQFQVKKKRFNRNSILELLGQYEAREERMNE